LSRISQQAGFSFSYNSTLIPDNQTVTISLKDKTVREALNEIFKGTMDYKEKGNHVILTKVAVKQKPASATFIISGDVEDALTKVKLTEVSVYEKKSITSVVTDQSGFFKMKLEKKEEPLSISISKKGYLDTVIVSNGVGDQFLHISMQPEVIMQASDTAVSPVAKPDSVEVIPVADHEKDFSLPYASEPNVINIRDTLHRKFQASLFPFIGSNGRLSGNAINDYSFNLFAGYSQGTRKVEVAGFVNIDRGNVSWLQVAGFGNIVGGNVYGIQASSFFNLNGGETNAIQFSGFVNVNFRQAHGVQISGLSNFNWNSANGVLVAGFANYARGNSNGVQAAGFLNVHNGNYKGWQMACFANITKGTIDGLQASAFLNYAHRVNGSQISIFNYADSLTGAPIGLFSIVRTGYHQIELSADEIFYSNLAFRTGVKKFYNILLSGFQPQNGFDKDAVWTLGYGLGTATKLARWLDLNFDITSQHVNKGGFTESLSSLNKIHLGFDFRLAKKFSIYAGATVNGYFTKTSSTDYPDLFTNFTPKEFIIDEDIRLQMWMGGKLAVRFL